jgi:hypothetical protein
MILAIALSGVLVISAVAVAPHAYASGGLMSLVAHGAQDVYLTGNPTIMFKGLRYNNPLSEEVPGLGGNNTGNK